MLEKVEATRNFARNHARLFAQDFVALLEQLLLDWPKHSWRRGAPYPVVAAYYADGNICKGSVFHSTNRFLRDYGMFVVGDAGWRRKTWRGYRPVGS